MFADMGGEIYQMDVNGTKTPEDYCNQYSSSCKWVADNTTSTKGYCVDKSTKSKIEKLFNLKRGELEVISLAFGKKDTILTDDKKCLNAAKALKINFINSLDVIVALYRNGAISRARALESIDVLEEYGWYAKNLIKNYREALK